MGFEKAMYTNIHQFDTLPGRRELRLAATGSQKRTRRLRASGVIAAAVAAALAAGASAPVSDATFALWHDTLTIPLRVDPTVVITPPSVTEVPPPLKPQDGQFCFYVDDYQPNGIRRPEHTFNFGNLNALITANPTITLHYTAEVRNVSNRDYTGGPAVTFLGSRTASYAYLGSAEANTAVARNGLFAVPVATGANSPFAGEPNHPGWLVWDAKPSGSTTHSEFNNAAKISTPTEGLRLTLDRHNAQVFMYAQDRSGGSPVGSFSGWITPTTLRFTLTGTTTQALRDHLQYNAGALAQFNAEGITFSNNYQTMTWEGTRNTPGFYDNNTEVDAVTHGNGLRCENYARGIQVLAPAAPVSPVALRTSETTATLTWTAPNAGGGTISRYDIYIGSADSSAPAATTTPTYEPTGTGLSATLNNLPAGSRVWVRARSTAYGYGAWSEALVAEVTRQGGTVDLAWTNLYFDGAANIVYDVYRSTAAGTESAPPNNATTFTVSSPAHQSTGLTATTAYYFWVRPVSAGRNGPWHRISVNAVVAPTNLAAIRTSGTAATLSWTSPGGTVNGYQIYRASGNNPTAPTASTTITTSGANANGWTVTGNGTTYSATTNLTSGTSYTFWVRAVTGTNTYGAWSDAGTISGTVATAPTSLAAIRTSGTAATLSWVAPTQDGGAAITGYQIYRVSGTANVTAPTASTSITTSNSWTVTGTNTTYSATTNLTSGTSYTFWVRAVSGSLYGPWSVAGTISGTRPAQVSGLTRSSRYGAQVNIYWSAVTGSTGYDVYFSTSNSAPAASVTLTASNSVSTTTRGTSTSPFALTVPSNATYYIWVRAKSAVAVGDWSSSLNAGGVPTQMAALTRGSSSGSGTNRTYTFSWSAPSSNGGSAITKYQILRTTSSSAPAGNVTITTSGTNRNTWEPGAGTTSYSGVAAPTGTTYYFWIRAENANGFGQWSSTGVSTTAATLSVQVPAHLIGEPVEVVVEYLENLNFAVEVEAENLPVSALARATSLSAFSDLAVVDGADSDLAAVDGAEFDPSLEDGTEFGSAGSDGTNSDLPGSDGAEFDPAGAGSTESDLTAADSADVQLVVTDILLVLQEDSAEGGESRRFAGTGSEAEERVSVVGEAVEEGSPLLLVVAPVIVDEPADEADEDADPEGGDIEDIDSEEVTDEDSEYATEPEADEDADLDTDEDADADAADDSEEASKEEDSEYATEPETDEDADPELDEDAKKAESDSETEETPAKPADPETDSDDELDGDDLGALPGEDEESLSEDED